MFCDLHIFELTWTLQLQHVCKYSSKISTWFVTALSSWQSLQPRAGTLHVVRFLLLACVGGPVLRWRRCRPFPWWIFFVALSQEVLSQQTVLSCARRWVCGFVNTSCATERCECCSKARQTTRGPLRSSPLVKATTFFFGWPGRLSAFFFFVRGTPACNCWAVPPPPPPSAEPRPVASQLAQCNFCAVFRLLLRSKTCLPVGKPSPRSFFFHGLLAGNGHKKRK